MKYEFLSKKYMESIIILMIEKNTKYFSEVCDKLKSEI